MKKHLKNWWMLYFLIFTAVVAWSAVFYVAFQHEPTTLEQSLETCDFDLPEDRAWCINYHLGGN